MISVNSCDVAVLEMDEDKGRRGNQDAQARALVAGGRRGRAGQWRRPGKARAAVMSCTEPGSAGETHSGNPSGASTARTLPP